LVDYFKYVDEKMLEITCSKEVNSKGCYLPVLTWFKRSLSTRSPARAILPSLANFNKRV
jgi:hypothetical protein